MMTAPATPASRSWADALAVYLRPRVLIVMLLGFASGLPLALSGSTLAVWLTEAHIDLATIGLFSLVGLSSAKRLPKDPSFPVEMVGLYWHFVDIVWIVIFTVVYLIPTPSPGGPGGP